MTIPGRWSLDPGLPCPENRDKHVSVEAAPPTALLLKPLNQDSHPQDGTVTLTQSAVLARTAAGAPDGSALCFISLMPSLRSQALENHLVTAQHPDYFEVLCPGGDMGQKH